MATYNRGIVHLLVPPRETACRNHGAIVAVPAAAFDAEPRKCARCEAKRARMRAVSARRAERATEAAEG